jgi:zinc/manganese transport system permease protein
MLGHEFMRHAFLAGTAIALACGLVGYLVVLRGQVFAGDALSHVAFTGALVAAAVGVDVRFGLFAATLLVAVGMAALGARARADDVVVGSVFAWILGVGVLCLSIFTTHRSAGNGTAGVRVLFGSIFGLGAGQAGVAAAVALAVAVAAVVIARPLLFASVDPWVAAAQGVPVAALGVALLVLVGAMAAEATQAVGSLLLLGLLAAPAGAAHRLTASPYRGLVLAAGLAVAAMWAGLTLAYAVPAIPPSFAIIAAAAALHLGAEAATARPWHRGAPRRTSLAAPSGG